MQDSNVSPRRSQDIADELGALRQPVKFPWYVIIIASLIVLLGTSVSLHVATLNELEEVQKTFSK